MINILLVAVIALFIAWELVSFYGRKSRKVFDWDEANTLSSIIWWLETRPRFGWFVRALVTSALIVLFLHLVLHLF